MPNKKSTTAAAKKTKRTTKKAPAKKSTTKTKATAKKSTATKSVSKKTANKKQTSRKKATTTASKRAKKKETAPEAEYSPTVTLPEHAFWVNDGAVLHSLLELEQALQAMDRAVYEHHVSQDKHDFADWVEQALAEAACAEALRKARTPARARTVVVTHLKRYHQ